MLLILLPVQLAPLVRTTSSWTTRRSFSALLRLLRVRPLRCLALEKKTARLASRGGGERNKVLRGSNVHFDKAIVLAPATCFGWTPIGFRRNLPVGFLVAHHMARTLFRHNVVRGVDLIPP